jgi:uncharacterized protein YkwD
LLRAGRRRVLVALVASLAATPLGSSAQRPPVERLEARVFERVNAHRVAIGLPPLAPHRELAEIARRHSRAMASGRVDFGHQGFQSRGREAYALIPYRGFGENVSRHTRDAEEVPDAAMRKWLASRVHREHVEGEYDASGLGAAVSPEGTWYLTQLFVLR